MTAVILTIAGIVVFCAGYCAGMAVAASDVMDMQERLDAERRRLAMLRRQIESESRRIGL